MLKLENVSKFYYSTESVTCALRKINLEFKIGEFVSIVGESGSGKTTLLNVLSGLDSYQDGEMFYNGKPTIYFDEEDWERYRKEEVAFIFQNYNLIDSYTVLENVMAAYLLEGYSKKEAKFKAKEKLALVGLSNDSHKKATKLSGGQKQRLAIARALAKETNIIVADEPTGNLDSKNGEQVLTLLKELSKEKLVIVVTHNQDEIEPYITRKIRLIDGEVVEDISYQEIEDKKPTTTIQSKEKVSTALNFALLNIKSQPKKCFLMFMLMLVFVLSSFVFVSNFEANLDENKTKILKNDLFINKDETRLLVKTSNDDLITDEILSKSMVDHVISYEKYDYITDCNYYRLGDYRWKYSGGTDDSGAVVDSSSYVLLDHSKFMRSSSSLKTKDLAYGRLPENDFEMVVYGDSSLVGTKELVFFSNDRKWGIDAYLKYEVEIVGVLKNKTSQAYFSDTICEIMELSQTPITVSFNYYEYKGLNKYKRQMSFVKVFIDPTLNEDKYRVSQNKFAELVKIKEFQDPNTSVIFNGSKTTSNSEMDFSNSHSICIDGIALSKDMFKKLYSQVKDKKQFAIFIDDYANLDKVSKELFKKGFDSISCFNASTAGYDMQKVIVRYVNLVISICAVLLISVVIIAIGNSILKIKKNDYIILKMIGMSFKCQKRINFIELLFYIVISTIILPIFVYIIGRFVNNLYVIEIMKYIRVRDYFITLVISILMITILGYYFDKYLKKKINVTELKEE